jgi:hypothetical protein
MSKKYSQEDIQAMASLQSQGFSAQEIADICREEYPGITRNAVLGVLFRWRNK